MDGIINLTVICNECGHNNLFKVKGKHIYTYNSNKVPILDNEEVNKKRICEICGAVM